MGIEDPDADVAEQLRPAVATEADEERVPDPSGVPLEADPADVAEQREGPVSVPDSDVVPLEADPADVAEQREVVPEDYEDLRG